MELIFILVPVWCSCDQVFCSSWRVTSSTCAHLRWEQNTWKCEAEFHLSLHRSQKSTQILYAIWDAAWYCHQCLNVTKEARPCSLTFITIMRVSCVQYSWIYSIRYGSEYVFRLATWCFFVRRATSSFMHPFFANNRHSDIYVLLTQTRTSVFTTVCCSSTARKWEKLPAQQKKHIALNALRESRSESDKCEEIRGEMANYGEQMAAVTSTR